MSSDGSARSARSGVGRNGGGDPIVDRQIVDQPPHHEQGLDVVRERPVGDARLRRVRDGASQLFVSDRFVRHGLHHFRTGDVHVRTVVDHEDEIGHRRRIDGAAGARPHDQRYLRNHPRGEHVSLKHLRIAGQRRDTFLNASAARIVEPDHRRTHLHGMIHDLADLLRVRFRERSAEDREVLAKHKHHAAVHRAVARDDAVARNALLAHSEVGAAVLDEHVPFFERAGIEQ